MLEVFYETETKVVTAWRSEHKQGIRPIRKGEAKVMLDISPPSDEGATVRDYIYDDVTGQLVLRADFTNPKLKRNEARAKAIQAIKDNATVTPWGKILNDMAIAQGWIEPE